MPTRARKLLDFVVTIFILVAAPFAWVDIHGVIQQTLAQTGVGQTLLTYFHGLFLVVADAAIIIVLAALLLELRDRMRS